jgi:hypothetical protein
VGIIAFFAVAYGHSILAAGMNELEIPVIPDLTYNADMTDIVFS